MNLTPIKANMTEIDTGRFKILFSYKTPVALFDREKNQYEKTEKRWSVTTSRHITQWVSHLSESVEWVVRPQEYFDNLLAKVK